MSPTIYRFQNYRFFFFSREEKRIHVHITSPTGEAKFWLEPNVQLAVNDGFNEKELKLVEKIVVERQKEFIDEWHKHFIS